MIYTVFEGKKDIRGLDARTGEHGDFEEIKEKLGFKYDIDLVALCASIGMYGHVKGNLKLEEPPRLVKLVGMETFEDRRLFDFLLIVHQNEKKNRMDKFEKFFYTGFKVLKKWLNDREPDTGEYELEKFADIWDYVSKKYGKK